MSFSIDENEKVSVLDELSLWSAPFGMRLLDTIRMANVHTILDVGSGLGFPALELAMRFGDDTTIYALDPWEAGNARLKWKAVIAGTSNLHVITGSAEKMPFPDNMFDLIVSNNGLNNVQDFSKALKECRRVAKVNGQFVFTVNTEETMIEFYSVFRSVLTQHGLKAELSHLTEHIHSKRKPLPMIDLSLEDAGFQIISKTTDSFQFRYANGSAMFKHFFIRTAFLTPWQEILNENQRSTIFSEIEQQLNHIANEQGELRLTIPFITYNCVPYSH